MEFITHVSGSTGNLHQVKSNSGSLLIEAGVSIRCIRQALGFKLSDIEACLITHSHADHCKAAADLAGSGIDVCMTRETAEAISLDGHRLKIIDPLKQFKVGTWTILPFPTQHDCPGSVGFLISDGSEKLVFATDTFYVRYRFKGLTHMAVECNWSKETLATDLDPVRKHRLYRSHFSLTNVIAFFKANDMHNVREIHLIHISRENGDPEYFQSEVEKATGKPVYIK